MADRKYGLLNPSLQAQLHYQALLSRLPESGPLERVNNNDPALYHNVDSSYLPPTGKVDLAAPPLMFGGGAKDSTLPTFRPSPDVLAPTLSQMASLLRSMNVPTAGCVTANDYAVQLSSHLRRHFDVNAPLSTIPQLTAGEIAAKKKLMEALDDDGGSIDMARAVIKRLRGTVAKQQERIDELLRVRVGLNIIIENAAKLRHALEDMRQTVKFQYLDSQDLVLKCGDAFREMTGVDVFSAKLQLLGSSGNQPGGGPGLSVVAQEQLQRDLEQAGVVGGDPFKDRLTTCVYTLNIMKRFVTVALQRTPLNPEDAPTDAARFDWDNDDSAEGKKFKRRFPSVLNLARKMGIAAHDPRARPQEGLPSFMEPLATYNTPSQELALVKAMITVARDVSMCVQLVAVLANKAGVSMSKSLRVADGEDARDSIVASPTPRASKVSAENINEDNASDQQPNRKEIGDSEAHISALESDLQQAHEKLAASEARVKALEAELAGPGPSAAGAAVLSPVRSKKSPMPAKMAPASKGPGKSAPVTTPKTHKAATPQPTGPPPRLSKTDLQLPERDAPSKTPSTRPPSSSGPPQGGSLPVLKESVFTQTSDNTQAQLDELTSMNATLQRNLADNSVKIESIERELDALRALLHDRGALEEAETSPPFDSASGSDEDGDFTESSSATESLHVTNSARDEREGRVSSGVTSVSSKPSRRPRSHRSKKRSNTSKSHRRHQQRTTGDEFRRRSSSRVQKVSSNTSCSGVGSTQVSTPPVPSSSALVSPTASFFASPSAVVGIPPATSSRTSVHSLNSATPSSAAEKVPSIASLRRPSNYRLPSGSTESPPRGPHDSHDVVFDEGPAVISPQHPTGSLTDYAGSVGREVEIEKESGGIGGMEASPDETDGYIDVAGGGSKRSSISFDDEPTGRGLYVRRDTAPSGDIATVVAPPALESIRTHELPPSQSEVALEASPPRGIHLNVAVTPEQLYEARRSALQQQRSLTDLHEGGSRGGLAFVSRLRNALTAPLPAVPVDGAPLVDAASAINTSNSAAVREDAAPRSRQSSRKGSSGIPGTTRRSLQPGPNASAAGASSTAVLARPTKEISRIEALEEVRRQLLSMSSNHYSPARPSRDDNTELPSLTSRQVVFAPVMPIPNPANPEGLRRL